ncbi:MAG: adenine deaminase [Anaerolineae bacterium]|nr:adenine deaminase [Anaerolineae bacterium]
MDSFRLTDSRSLVDCAMGRVPADLLIRNGRWVCVQSGEIIPGTQIAVLGQRIAAVGPDLHQCVGPNTRILDAAGRYLVPGLLDAHMHVESGMLTVAEFAHAVIPHGTTGMFIDPHEIANVLGLPGVKLMLDEAALQPVHIFVQVPSCVPSAPGLETSGAVIGPEEVREALNWPGVIGLGEMMNYPGVAFCDADVHEKLAATRQAGKVIGGHYPAPDLNSEFAGYVAGGAMDDHEGTRLEDAVARVRQGMRAMLRFGSAWHDVAEQVRAVTELKLDPRNFILCTDDCHSATLIGEGHMDRAVRHAISQGLPPLTAIQMATINTAEHFGVAREMGQIAPMRYADILIVTDLVNFRPDVVIARGVTVAEHGRLLAETPGLSYPDWALRSVHLARELTAADFRLPATDGRQMANVIGVIENQAPTRHLHVEVRGNLGEIRPDMARDLAKVALVERHTGSGTVQVGLVRGFGFSEPCGLATTVAHDSHQMIVIGTDEADMARAANRLALTGGGQVVVRRGEVIGEVNLPIAGLISNEPAELVARKAESVLAGFRACGCKLNNPNMQMSLLGLVVIPELRISDKGLVDVRRFTVVDVLE